MSKRKTLRSNSRMNGLTQSCDDSFNNIATSTKNKKIKNNVIDKGDIIISFNIGGQIYQISKDLLQKYPDTMLCMAASDIEICNEDDPIFIERNGQQFQYVLDYMRGCNMIHSMDSLSTGDRKEFYQNMECYGFRCDHDIYFPKDVMYLDEIQYHQTIWDISVASAGLVFDCKNQVVQVDSRGLKTPRSVNHYQTIPSSQKSWQSVMGTVGYSRGIHFWNFEILEDNNGHIMIGVTCKQTLVMNWNYLGSQPCDVGIGYHGKTGNVYYNGTYSMGMDNTSFGPTFSKGDIIGTLLNMNRHTVTFYKNGVRVGTILNSCWISGGNTCYPCVSLSSSNQKIRTVSHNEIFT